MAFGIAVRRRRIPDYESGSEWYQRMLLDPRWIRKRDRILKRDKYRCKRCGDKNSILHVHHLWYDGRPWEVSNRGLITLCDTCHEKAHRKR